MPIDSEGLTTAVLEIPYRETPDGPWRKSREEITYRLIDGIPIRFVEYLDDREVRRVEVLELQIQER